MIHQHIPPQEQFTYFIMLSRTEKLGDYIVWCQNNLTERASNSNRGSWLFNHTSSGEEWTVHFTNIEDAALFALTWLGQ